MHGWSLYAVFTAHMVCMAVAMRQRVGGLPITRQINSPMSIMKVNPQLGVAAYIMWTFTVLSALDVFRRKMWGTFYVSHFSFFPAMSLTLFHNRPRNLPWLAAAIGFFYIDAGTRFWMKFMRKSKVEAAEALPGGVAKLTISTGASMAYEPGQYVWIAFPGLEGPEPLPGFSCARNAGWRAAACPGAAARLVRCTRADASVAPTAQSTRTAFRRATRRATPRTRCTSKTWGLAPGPRRW